LLLKDSENVPQIIVCHRLLPNRLAPLGLIDHTDLSPAHRIIEFLQHSVFCIIDGVAKFMLVCQQLVLQGLVDNCDAFLTHQYVEFTKHYCELIKNQPI
jgi:hypothetical protein